MRRFDHLAGKERVAMVDASDHTNAGHGTYRRVDRVRTDSFEHMVLELTAELINPKQLDASIDEVLNRIGQYCGADRAYVFLLRDDNVTIDNTHEWCADGIEPEKEKLQGIVVADELPWFWKHMVQRRVFHVPRVRDLPPEARAEREHFEWQDIQSLVVVPMESDGRFIGFMGFDAVRDERHWSAHVIGILTLAGNVVSRAIMRRRVEDALRSREEEIANVYESVPLPTLVIDAKFRIQRANLAAQVICADGAGETGMRPGAALRCVHALATPAGCGFSPHCPECSIRNQITETLRSGKAAHWRDHRLETIVDNAFGETEVTEWTVSSVPVTLHGERHVLVTLLDVTQQREAERQLRQREIELAHVLRLNTMGETVVGLTHELTQPLYAIDNYVSGVQTRLQRHTLSDESLAEVLLLIQKEAQRAIAVVRNVRNFARRGKSNIVRQDMNDIIRNVGKLIEIDVRRVRATLELKLAPGLPPVPVDRVQIEQVLVNFLRNALDAVAGLLAARRAITIMSRCDTDGSIMVAVADRGTGITATAGQRIFDAFFTTKPEGLGMGLAVCRSIIENHHGEIGFRPNMPDGTVFFFRLPVTQDLEDADGRESTYRG